MNEEYLVPAGCRRCGSDLRFGWERFIPEPNSGCWLWLGSSVRALSQARAILICSMPCGAQNVVNRLMWMCLHGPIPDSLFVLHTCDTGLCINPDHLYLGDQAQNMRDVSNRERHHRRGSALPRGVRQLPSGNWNARLSLGNRMRNVGTYPSAAEAENAYRAARIRHGLLPGRSR